MRFEVNVEADLDALHKARDAYNIANPQAAAPDMPSFVQRLMDQAVSTAMQPFGPSTLSAALTKIAELEAEKVVLSKEVAALAPTSAAPAKLV